MSRLRLALLLAALAVALTTECCTASYLDPGDEDVDISGADYSDEPIDQILQDVASKRSSLIYVFRRACIRRGGNCDHRPGDCCHSSSCRCNLWGANCRCQRMGLFQKWG